MPKGLAAPPTWLLGFGFLPLGINGGVTLITMPQLLSGDHVPEQTISHITALALAAGFFSFLLSPILDWRFSRKTYALGLTCLCALSTFAVLMLEKHVAVLAPLFFGSSLCAFLVCAAAGGWFGNFVASTEKNRLGAWFAAINIASGGGIAVLAIPLLRDLPYPVGAGVIAGLILMTAPLFLVIDCPPADGRLASESFANFARDVGSVLKKPSVLWTLMLFVSPATAFALTNALGGFGRDFNTSERLVSLLGGAGVTVAGLVGSLLIPRISTRIAPRTLYLLVGGTGAIFSLALILAPRNPISFALALLGENVFQAAAFSVSNLIMLRTLSDDDPLASTQVGMMLAASAVPLTYMQVIDGHAYSFHGVVGSFAADALISGGVCLALALVLRLFRRRIPAI